MHFREKLYERIMFLNAFAARKTRLRHVDTSTYLHAIFRSAFVRKLTAGTRMMPQAGEPVIGCRPYTFEGRTVYWPVSADTVSLKHSYWEVYYDRRGHMFDTPGTEMRQGDIVIDCGACEGFFTMKALEKGAGKVYCIEPARTMTKCLNKSFAKDIDAGRVELVESLLGDTAGEAMFLEDPTDPATGRLLNETETDGSAYPVSILTIDGLCEEYGIKRVDYIKADVEGAEEQLVRGAAGTISKHLPRLSVAVYHAPDNFERVRSIVESAVPDYTFRLKGLVISQGDVTPMILHCMPPAG